MEQHYEELKAAGLQVLCIGLGEAKHAERYCGRLAPSLTCFADNTEDAYDAWGLRQGTMAEFAANSLNVMKATLKAIAAGQVQGKATGNTLMLPGTFIVDRDGMVRYAYYSRYAGDDPAIETLIKQSAISGQRSAKR